MLMAPAIVLGQGQTLFFENFETGGPGWTYDNANHGQWHIAPNGECLSITKMAAYNRGPTACNYSLGTSGNSGILFSPSFTLTGLPPHTIKLDYIRAAAIQAATCLNVVIAECGQIAPVGCFNGNLVGLRSIEWNIPAGYQDRHVVLAFYFNTLPGGTNNPGFYVDNIEVTNSGIFGDFDGDLDVDINDFNTMLDCYTGPPVPYAHCLSPECAVGIFGNDSPGSGETCGDEFCPPPLRCSAIDCHTWDAFQSAWTGPGPLPEFPLCNQYGDVNRDGLVGIDDILCMLACFGGSFTCAGDISNADISPCGGDGIVNLDDSLAILAAFTGQIDCQ